MSNDDTFQITISQNGKHWSIDTEKQSWPELLEEFLYGLSGMGFFIGPNVHDEIDEALRRANLVLLKDFPYE